MYGLPENKFEHVWEGSLGPGGQGQSGALVGVLVGWGDRAGTGAEVGVIIE